MSPALAPAHAPERSPRHAPAGRPAPRRSHLRVVPKPSAPRSGRVERTQKERSSPPAAVFGGLAVLFVVLFAVAVLQTQNVAGQMHLDRVQQSLSDREAEAQSLRLEAASLAAPGRIVAVAAEMGMTTPPGGPTFVSQVAVDDGGARPTVDVAVDGAVVAAPEPEVSLDETAAGPVVTEPAP